LGVWRFSQGLLVHWRESWAKAENDALEKAGCPERVDQAMNAKEFTVCAGVSYSTARSWFRLPGFPVFHGVIFWQDFVQWRTNQNGIANQHEKLPHNNGVSTAAASKLPPRAAQILLDA
jgi:hypothetical protein